MKALRRRAETLQKRWGLSYQDLLAARFAVNVGIATTIIWMTLRFIEGANPIWAIASMVAAADPDPGTAKNMFRSRLINVSVGCATGLVFVAIPGNGQWVLPIALSVTVLVSSYLVRIKTMWRQAPITAAIVIAAALVEGSATAGIGRGLHKVADVIFGCVVGVLVSLTMSKVWLIRPPAKESEVTAVDSR